MAYSSLLSTIAIAAGGAAISSQTLTWGQVYNFEPPASLDAGTGDYSATNVPLGMTFDATLGKLTGPAAHIQKATDMVISRAGAPDATISLGVTAMAGYRAPRKDYLGFDMASMIAADLWTRDNAIGSNIDANADRTAFINEYNACVADTGTAGALKFHRITYTGAHLNDATAREITFAHVNAGNPYTYIFVVAEHPDDDYNETMRLMGGDNTIWVNFWAYGIWNFTGGRDNQYHHCRFGNWWNGEVGNGGEAIFRQQNYKLSFTACEVGGLTRLVGGRGGNLFFCDVYSHHNSEDTFFPCTWDGSGGDFNIYGFGHVSHRQMINGSHCDGGMQLGSQYDAAQWSYDEYFVADYIAIVDTGGYAGTGQRPQRNGGCLSAMPKMEAHNCITLISGHDGIVSGFDDEAIVNGFIVLPAPALGGLTCRLDLGFAASATVSNVITNGFRNDGGRTEPGVGGIPAVTGVAITNLSISAASGSNSIAEVFPNLPGGVVSKVKVANDEFAATNKWVPDPFDEEISYTGIRNLLSTYLLRGANWNDPLNPVKNPATFGRFSDTVPGSTRPVLTGLTVDGSAETAQVTTDQKGYLYWFVSNIDDPDVCATQVFNRQVSNGTWALNNGSSPFPSAWCAGHVWQSAPGAISIPIDWSFLTPGTNYFLYVAFESAPFGKFSDVSKTAAFQEAA